MYISVTTLWPITLDGIRSNSLKKENQATALEAEIQDKRLIQAEMAEAEAIQSVITWAAIQVATAAVMVMREADAEPISGTNIAVLRDVHRQRHGG